MNTNIEKLEDSQVKVEITVDAEKFDAAMDQAFKKNSKYFVVPGFRKGKAPRKMVEKQYGEGVLYEEAFNIVAPEIFDEIVKENKLEVVSTPEIDITQIGAGKELKFSAKFTVKPEFKLGKYKGIAIEKKDYKVTDEDVQKRLDEMAEQNARLVTADKRRKLKVGDTAVIDFEGFVDGVAFDGGKAEGHSLEIGSGAFIPGFEDQLVGMKYEEEKEIKVTFPKEYMSEDLAGKEATFKVKLHEIKEKQLPEIDDEFVKDVSEFDTLEELKDDIREDLEEDNANRAKYEEEEEAVNKVLEATEIKLPEVMIENEVDAYIHDMEHNLYHQNFDMKSYLEVIGKTMEELRAEYHERAEKNVKTRLVLEAIFEKEKLEVTDDNINAKLEEFAKAYGRDTAEFVKKADARTKEYVKEELKYDVAVKFIVANAK